MRSNEEAVARPRARDGQGADGPVGWDAWWAGSHWSDGAALALIDAQDPGGRGWTYGDLAGLARQRALVLRRAGLAAGQLVAVAERPAADLVLMQHALARVGAGLLPVRPQPGSEPVRALLARTGAEWIWDGQGALLPVLSRGETAPDGADREPWDSPLALAVETSGSTGTPRAAMLEARNVLTSAALSNRRLGLGPGDAWLCCLPLRHIGGLSIAYRCGLAGALMVLRPGFEAQTVADDLARHAITHVSLVPPMLARLLDLGAGRNRPPSGLRVVLVGGQHLSEPLARRAIDLGWPIHATYGMTETGSQIATSGRLAAPPPEGRVGRPLPGLDLDCPGSGEPPRRLRVRGPLVMAGYANPERVRGQGLEDGWFATSDLACVDPDGTLRILGRADEVLVTGGVNVHPARVEAALLQAPGVRDLAVVGLPDPVWGQRLAAIYCGEAQPADLDAWSRARLASPERPRAFVRIGELPLLESGKRDRRGLIELARLGIGPD